VGTHFSTEKEKSRGSLHDIALAASNRCSEALRVVEEFLKLHSAQHTIESIRYTMYDLSAEVIRGLGSTNKQQWKCCFIMTLDDCALPWKKTLTQALIGGCDCVQIREKAMQTKALIRHVLEVKEISDKHDVPIIVNDRVDVMLATNTAGVHLGKDDMPIVDARKISGKGRIIGATAHSEEEVVAATEAGADYIGVGAMFTSSTKPTATVEGPRLLKYVEHVHYLAVGGITPENVHHLYAAGCKGIAVSSSIAHATNPENAVHGLLKPEVQLT
jgi:thiamine-phosphate pyrophosphorylase